MQLAMEAKGCLAFFLMRQRKQVRLKKSKEGAMKAVEILRRVMGVVWGGEGKSSRRVVFKKRTQTQSEK
jgi:hypothetical protein